MSTLRVLAGTFWFLGLTLAIATSTNLFAQIRELPSSELIDRLGKPELDVRRDAAYELARRLDGSQEVVRALAKASSDKDMQVQLQVLIGLGRVGEAAEPAIPELLKCLKDGNDQIRYRAADALGKIGIASLQPLLDRWPTASERERIATAQAFGLMGSKARPAITVLQESLAKPDGKLPRYVAEALVSILPNDESSLISLMEHGNVDVRQTGIAGLVALKKPSEKATEAIGRAMKDAEPKIRETAIVSLAKSKIPTSDKAVFVEAGLLDSEPSVRAAAIVSMRLAKLTGQAFAQRIAARLKDADSTIATSLVRGLAVIGEDARTTLPVLLERIERDPLDSELASRTLASFGAAAIDDLIAAIEKYPKSEPVISQALSMIGKPAVPALTAAIRHESELIRVAATRALGGLPSPGSDLIEQLAVAATDVSPQVRTAAVAGLIASGTDNSRSREAILQATRDQQPAVRSAAIAALSRFKFEDAQIAEMLSRSLSDTTPEVRIEALKTLALLQEPLKANVARVVELSSDSVAQVRQSAVESLGKLGKDSLKADQTESVVTALLLRLADAEPPIQIAATKAVQQLGLLDKKVLDAVASNLAEEIELLQTSLEAIAGFGSQAKELIPTVSNLVGHTNANVRMSAIQTLVAIEKDPAQLTNHLLGVLEDSEWQVRQVAGAQLGKLGRSAQAAVPKLFMMLKNDQDTDFASSALKEIDTAPVEAVGLLLENVESKEKRIGFYAISLLGKIGPPAAEALPKLEAMLESAGQRDGDARSEFRQKFLRDAIASIKGESKPKE